MNDWLAAVLWTLPVAALMIGAGLLVAGISRRAADGRLGPNRIAGIRTSATRRSEAAWVAAHQAGHAPTMLAALTMGLSGPLAVVAGLAVSAAAASDERADAYQGAFTVVLVALVAAGTVLVVAGAVRGNRAAQEVTDGEGET